MLKLINNKKPNQMTIISKPNSQMKQLIQFLDRWILCIPNMKCYLNKKIICQLKNEINKIHITIKINSLNSKTFTILIISLTLSNCFKKKNLVTYILKVIMLLEKHYIAILRYYLEHLNVTCRFEDKSVLKFAEDLLVLVSNWQSIN